MKDNERLAVVLATIVILLISMANLISRSRDSFRVSAVETTTSLGVYWDSNCTTIVYSIDWGTLMPGEVKEIAIYVRNEGSEACLLNVRAVNWQGDNTSDCVAFSCQEPEIDPGETVQIAPSLLVSLNASESLSFSFDIVLEAAPTGASGGGAGSPPHCC